MGWNQGWPLRTLVFAAFLRPQEQDLPHASCSLKVELPAKSAFYEQVTDVKRFCFCLFLHSVFAFVVVRRWLIRVVASPPCFYSHFE
jgi:hypothetical protein